MALDRTNRPATRRRPTNQRDQVRRSLNIPESWTGITGLTLICVITVCLGCSASGRHVAKKSSVPENKLSSGESVAGAKEKKTAVAPNQKREPEPSQKPSDRKMPVRTGQTELETVRDIAINLTRKHAPVERIRLCYAKKTGEWWITLFQDEGHAFDVKQYIWNRSNDKLDPFCVPKVIARDALDDYLLETRGDKKCTAFKRTNKGWTAIETRSSKKNPATSSNPSGQSDRRPRAAEFPKQQELRLVRPDDKEHNLDLTSISTVPPPATDYVFVYGSEMKHTDLISWLRGRGYKPELLLDASAAKLEGYDFVWNYYSTVKGGGTANIQPSKDSSVWGLLLEVNNGLITALDRKQGSPGTYCRGPKRIPVRRITDGRTVLAWVYRAKPNRNGSTDIWPTTEYKRGIVEAASFWGFPKPYLQKIGQWHTSR